MHMSQEIRLVKSTRLVLRASALSVEANTNFSAQPLGRRTLAKLHLVLACSCPLKGVHEFESRRERQIHSAAPIRREFDNSTVRASWSPARPPRRRSRAHRRGMRRAAPNNLVGSAIKSRVYVFKVSAVRNRYEKPCHQRNKFRPSERNLAQAAFLLYVEPGSRAGREAAEPHLPRNGSLAVHIGYVERCLAGA